MTSWKPSASINNLKKRAVILQKIRAFFAERDVLEVDTPLMCHTSVTDPYIDSIPVTYLDHHKPKTFYLQTSPEYMMKRLLAAGSGSIYQLCKAFRQDEKGKLHNPEFTMLEWYRTDFDHHALMNEMDELLQSILNCEKATRYSYEKLFLKYLEINPHTASTTELINCAANNHINITDNITDNDTWLQLLLSHCIEPKIGFDAPCFIYDYPITQAALARIQDTTPKVASRFEVYINGIELANGFHELQNASEQRKRFEKNLVERENLNKTLIPIDELFLAALEHGLPDCAGVALGLDRLIMITVGAKSISEVTVLM